MTNSSIEQLAAFKAECEGIEFTPREMYRSALNRFEGDHLLVAAVLKWHFMRSAPGKFPTLEWVQVLRAHFGTGEATLKKWSELRFLEAKL